MNEKRLWRQRCREIRGVRAREAGPMLEEAFERCLEEVKTGTIGICWPFGSESDLRAAALRWCGDDSARCLAVPAVEETGIRYRLWGKDTPLTKDRAGLTVPDAEAVFPDLIFVPALGYSSQGHRLGYGGGYFRPLPRRESSEEMRSHRLRGAEGARVALCGARPPL